jgi:prepilin-type N-terminal cleavage/methylation domain-containing protein
MKKKGFTLIELMIVVAIIAILAAAALPAFGEQIKKSKDGKAVQLLGLMRTQFGMVQADMDGYPVATSDALTTVSTTSKTAVASAMGAKATSVLGIDGYFKQTYAAAGDQTIAAGTPATGIAWAYTVNTSNATWTASYSSTSDTKGQDWGEY